MNKKQTTFFDIKDKSFKTIFIHFEDKEDIKEFSELIDQRITSKTQSIWYPKIEIKK